MNILHNKQLANNFNNINSRTVSKCIPRDHDNESIDSFGKLPKSESTVCSCNKLKRIWEETKKTDASVKKNLFYNCIRSYSFFNILLVSFGFLIIESLKIVECYFLLNILELFMNKKIGSTYEGYYWLVGISLSLCFRQLIKKIVIAKNRNLAVVLKNGTIGLLYKKLVQLRKNSLNYVNLEYINKLMTEDAEQIKSAFTYSSYLVLAPFQLITIASLLWYKLGAVCFITVGIIILLLLIKLLLYKASKKIRRRVLYTSEKRINLMKELITIIRTIKIYCLEAYFANVVFTKRSTEISYKRKLSLLKAISSFTTITAPYLLSLCVFSIYYKFTDDNLTIPNVFFAISLFHAINDGMLVCLPNSISSITEAYQACRRVTIFLQQDEVKTKSPHGGGDRLGPFLSYKDVTVSWEKTSEEYVFKNLTLQANQQNCLIIILGPSDSGKSSVLLTALKELNMISGELSMNGKIGYTPQQPWIFCGTVRQNILFGQPFDRIHYERVVTACALKSELDYFTHADETYINDIQLTNEQKTKISLARAVYANRDIYLLDDPFQYFDGKTAKFIFDNCIRQLLKNKIVLLTTDRVQYVEYATEIICLKENGAHIQGTLQELSSQHIDLFSITQPASVEKQWDHDSAIETDHFMIADDSISMNALSGISLDIGSSAVRKSRDKRSKNNDHGSLHSFHSDFSTSNHMENQEKENQMNKISLKTYLKYSFGNGCCTSFIMYFFIVCGMVGFLLTDYWLAEWSMGEDMKHSNQTYTSVYYFTLDTNNNLLIFIAFVVISLILTFITMFFYFIKIMKYNQELHDIMVERVLLISLSFFETISNSQLLDIFSSDINILDMKLPKNLFRYFQSFLLLLAIIIVNCIVVPYLVILFVPVFIILIIFRKRFLTTYQKMKNVEKTSKIPFATHLHESLRGLTSIRAFNVQDELIKEFYHCQDYIVTVEKAMTNSLISYWNRIEIIALLCAIVCLFAPLVAAEFSDIDVVIVAISFTYTLLLVSTLQTFMLSTIDVNQEEKGTSQDVDVENQMRSVSRVFKYADMNAENDDGSSKDMRDTWPEYGLISCEGASFAYDQSLPYVLKKLFFCIRPMEKVGIVGRSGAGKSSLISMLFRLGDITGKVMIDGVSIAELKLEDLRKAITAVPQNPVLFSGTLRNNVDPFQEYTDGDIWEVLEEIAASLKIEPFSVGTPQIATEEIMQSKDVDVKVQVQLKDIMMELPQKLHTVVTANDFQFTTGERQLLYLARALLCKTKILIIDEATCDVTMDTNALIQQTVRTKFKECTVLTIAHRLSTVMDCDRVMVLESGRVVEFDEPYELLQQSTGHFRTLVDQAGRHEATRLELLAEEAKQLRHVLVLQNQITYPGSHITSSKTKDEILDHFGTRVIYETSL